MCGYVCGELQTHSLRGAMFKTTPIKAGTRLIVALRAGGVMMVTSMLAGGGAGGLVVDCEGQHGGLGQKL